MTAYSQQWWIPKVELTCLHSDFMSCVECSGYTMTCLEFARCAMSTGVQSNKLRGFRMQVSLFEFPSYNSRHSGEFTSTHIMLKIPEEPEYKPLTFKIEQL